MLRTCTDEDIKWVRSMMPPEAPCGRTYDDVTHSTICPHEPLPPKLSEEELNRLLEKLEQEESS